MTDDRDLCSVVAILKKSSLATKSCSSVAAFAKTLFLL
jgi:hypothetical protein